MTAAADAVRPGPARSVAAIGAFDGVHRGHQALLQGVAARARELSARSVCVTFDPDPEQILRPDQAPLALCSIDERAARIGALGLDETYVWPFTPAVAQMSPAEFVTALCSRYGLVEVWVGANFGFGRGRSGTVDTLARLGEQHGYTVHVVSPVIDGDRPISSTRIRGLLSAGNVRDAAHLLGRYYGIQQGVVDGAHRGRQLGFPTANLVPPPSRVTPAPGVYAGRARVDAGVYVAVANLGSRPTFGEELPLLEVHLLDFEGDLYGRSLVFEFVERVRGIERFGSLDELKAQIARDIETARVLVEAAPLEP